jgi:hypothetical protein
MAGMAENQVPSPVVQASLHTLYMATVMARNLTIRGRECPLALINDLMEAIHSVPQMLMRFDDHTLRDIVLHCSCFDAERWRTQPGIRASDVWDLIVIFRIT